MVEKTVNLQKATLGGGCYWCTEAVLQRIVGVSNMQSGFAGGHTKNPSYDQVCKGNTGHAEVVNFCFDNQKISYCDLLKVFMAIHDPTIVKYKGKQVCTQYRSLILYHDEEQKSTAIKYIDELMKSGYYNKPIVTEIKQFEAFYPAEDKHQNFFNRNPSLGYCMITIPPKIKQLYQDYAHQVAPEYLQKERHKYQQ